MGPSTLAFLEQQHLEHCFLYNIYSNFCAKLIMHQCSLLSMNLFELWGGLLYPLFYTFIMTPHNA